MTTQRRITRPGMHDNEYMTVTCTPDVTAVEFFEYQGEAEGAARANLNPTTTTYVGKVLKQGEHAVRGTAQHIAVCVEVDAELRRALAARAGYKGNPPRAVVQSWIAGILSGQLRAVRDEYRTAQFGRRDDEATHPGVDTTHDYIKAGEQVYGHDLVHGKTPPAAMLPALVSAIAQLGIEAVPPMPSEYTRRMLAARGLTLPDEVTMPPTLCSCHPGRKCSNWPECESCGPARQ